MAPLPAVEFRIRFFGKVCYADLVPCSTGGALRDRHGRGARDAVAATCRSVLGWHADERHGADVKSRGPGIPKLMPSRRVMMIPTATVANKPGTGEIAYKREDHRAGNAGCRLDLW
ncbi:hypothetical protein [Bradyrhizobium sp. SZCCHNS3053]|uniref:hypothetical protein n=1 Tax=Bradyrhizobium sp. SZCCHNS3053 TaxID=3057322 RepID=UPI002916CA09|nr:hypothetical protein [Bradyrhizobium sp. SZCCHNS3053]